MWFRPNVGVWSCSGVVLSYTFAIFSYYSICFRSVFRDYYSDHYWSIRAHVKAACVFFFFLRLAGSVGEFRGHGTDGSSVLHAGWSAPDYSQQHRPGARLWKAPLQLQQVSWLLFRNRSVVLARGEVEFTNSKKKPGRYFISRERVVYPWRTVVCVLTEMLCAWMQSKQKH